MFRQCFHIKLHSKRGYSCVMNHVIYLMKDVFLQFVGKCHNVLDVFMCLKWCLYIYYKHDMWYKMITDRVSCVCHRRRRMSVNPSDRSWHWALSLMMGRPSTPAAVKGANPVCHHGQYLRSYVCVPVSPPNQSLDGNKRMKTHLSSWFLIPAHVKM